MENYSRYFSSTKICISAVNKKHDNRHLDKALNPTQDFQTVSVDLENHTRFVWGDSHILQEARSDGRYTYIYTNPDSYEPLAQVHNRINEEGERRQQTHYFHCNQIGIPREMTDKDSNLLWYGEYTA